MSLISGKSGSRREYEDLEGDAHHEVPEKEKRTESGEEEPSNLPDPGREIEMTAAVAGVVPDGTVEDTFTVEHAVNAIGFGKFQVKLSLLTGLCWMADSMEMMILSILSPALHCIWSLSHEEEAVITTVVFGGMMVSAVFWGNFSDKYGRKRALLLAAVFLFYYGLLSSFAPTFVWLLILRGLVGFTIGAVPQAVTLYAEFLPMKQRAKCVVLLDCFWALGACFEVLLAWLVMPTLNWRWLLALSSLPILLFACVCVWLPESARFQAASGESDKALATLKSIAECNGRPMLLGRLMVDDVQSFGRGRIRDLFHRDLKYTTLLLNFIWLASAFCYYGVVLMSTEMLEAGGDLCNPNSETKLYCQANCRQLTPKDYIDLLWTTLAEFPGIFITVLVIEKLGRKKTMAIEFFLFTGVCCALFYCFKSRTVLTLILFSARGLASGVFQAVYVYTPEVYPTTVRAIGVGTCSGMARLGAMVSPFIAQVLLRVSLPLAVSVYGLVAAMAGVASLLLPIETKGRPLQDRTH